MSTLIEGTVPEGTDTTTLVENVSLGSHAGKFDMQVSARQDEQTLQHRVNRMEVRIKHLEETGTAGGCREQRMKARIERMQEELEGRIKALEDRGSGNPSGNGVADEIGMAGGVVEQRMKALIERVKLEMGTRITALEHHGSVAANGNGDAVDIGMAGGAVEPRMQALIEGFKEELVGRIKALEDRDIGNPSGNAAVDEIRTAGGAGPKKLPRKRSLQTSAVPRKRSRQTSAGPKRPPSAFALYMKSIRAELRIEGHLSASDQSKAAGRRWKSLPDEEKLPFRRQAAQLSSEYHAQRDH